MGEQQADGSGTKVTVNGVTSCCQQLTTVVPKYAETSELAEICDGCGVT